VYRNSWRHNAKHMFHPPERKFDRLLEDNGRRRRGGQDHRVCYNQRQLWSSNRLTYRKVWAETQNHCRIHEHIITVSVSTATVQSLRRLDDQLETNIRGLESLGEMQENYGTLLVLVILQRLPPDTRCNLARHHGTGSYKLDELQRTIYREIDIMDSDSTYFDSPDV